MLCLFPANILNIYQPLLYSLTVHYDLTPYWRIGLAFGIILGMRPTTMNILYRFEQAPFVLCEIKLTMLPKACKKSAVIHWLLLDTRKKSWRKLHFLAMEKTNELETRRFEEGMLEFNSQHATLKLKAQTLNLNARDTNLEEEEKLLVFEFCQWHLKNMPFIQSEQTYSRLGTLADITSIINFHKKNDPEHFAPWNPLMPENFYHEDFWQTRIERSEHEFLGDESLRLFVFLQSSDELIATINFTNFERGPFQNCRLGYKIGKEFEGKGLMQESLQAGIQYIFDQMKFHRIEANYIPVNEKSGKLLRRLGFIEHGVAKNYLKINGRWQDHMLTSLINSSYRD